MTGTPTHSQAATTTPAPSIVVKINSPVDLVNAMVTGQAIGPVGDSQKILSLERGKDAGNLKSLRAIFEPERIGNLRTQKSVKYDFAKPDSAFADITNVHARHELKLDQVISSFISGKAITSGTLIDRDGAPSMVSGVVTKLARTEILNQLKVTIAGEANDHYIEIVPPSPKS